MTPRPDTAFIPKNLPEDQLFRSLKAQGIGFIEDLCGRVWTDYNVHDPGITILEQCCYAMTEMAYRAGFDVADILAKETGEIPYDRLGLYPAHEIFPNRALTPAEYEHLIYDAVDGIDNVWVEPVRSGPVAGLYRIRYKVKERQEPAAAEETLRAVFEVFCRNRNLCEDVLEIHAVANRYFSLHAEVEVAGHAGPSQTLARIYHDCAGAVSPGLAYATWEDLMSQGRSPEQVFDGPLLKNGFMAGRKRAPRAFLNVADLSAAILAVPDVLGVKSLFLRDEKTGERFCDLIPLEDPESAPCLTIPDREGQIEVTLLKKKQQVLVGFEAFDLAHKGLEQNEPGLSEQELEKSRRLPGGRFSDLGQYHSIIGQFPNVYGINRFGVPPSYPAEDRARAKQLKAYLLFFEQPMINFMETLARIPDLFSLDETLDRTSFAALLDDSHAPDIAHLYIEGTQACQKKLGEISKKYDRFFDRRNRVLDYLLSLYGERLSQHALRRFNYYFSQTGLERWLIRNKIRFLRYLPRVSGGRSAGFNYLARSWNTENIDGLKLKVSLLLGFQYPHSRSLTLALTQHGLELIADKDLPELKKGTVEIQYVDPSDIQGKVAAPFRKIGFSRMGRQLKPEEIRRLFRQIVFLQNNLLNASFMVNGLGFGNYRLGRFKDRSWQLIFKPYDQARWCYLGSFPDYRQARQAANHLRYFIKTLNIMSEGCHVIDHVLLRPSSAPDLFKAVPADFYSLRVSVVFPSWPARCTNAEFRKLAEETVRINAPAHVGVDVYWFGFQEMLAFEIILHDWLAQKALCEGPETDGLAAELIGFLARHDHCRSDLTFL